ncbi:mycofactocin-associated electron transfer flavoprotein beta subunit [Carbonactinospora thermoautotrophica]|uniref:mycofactocin-associated electron transfer flavoprotein beta subunit n=1 Tax=Carbonactinospora thermoautotrophica TaxID=1469144 RepID=UPI003DA8B060
MRQVNPDGPLVVAALRWTDLNAHVDPLTGQVDTDPRTSGASDADRCALEHALRIAEAWGGRVLAVTAGPPDADAMLREALAVGAHAALRVDTPDTWHDVASDGSAVAAAIARAVHTRHGLPDLVLCGVHSVDRGTGAVSAFLAHVLGATQALGLLDVQAGAPGEPLRCVRRLDGGYREVLQVSAPAVLSVEPTHVRLRRASLPALLAAREAPIDVVGAGPTRDPRVTVDHAGPYRPRPRVLPPPASDNPRERLLALTGALVERTPPRVVVPENVAAAADELLAFLRQHGYLS